MPCDHKYIHLETVKQTGERPSFGMSPAKEWKKIEVYFCERCLEKRTIKEVAPGWEAKPEWF